MVRRSSDSSVAYVFGTSIGRGSSPGARCQNFPRYGPVATYVTTSTSSPASSKARSRARSYRVETISWCGAPRSRRSGGSAGEEPVHRLRLGRRLEAAVQLVVERAGAVHRRDVLRDAREVERAVARVAERRGEVVRRGRPPPSSPSTGTTRPATSALTISASASRSPPPFRPGASPASWRRIDAWSRRTASPGSRPELVERALGARRRRRARRHGAPPRRAPASAARRAARAAGAPGRATRAPGRPPRRARARRRSRSAPRPRRAGARRAAGPRSAPTPRRRTRRAAGRARGRARAGGARDAPPVRWPCASASSCSKRRASICSGVTARTYPGRPRDDDVGAERLSEGDDGVLQCRGRGRRRIGAVELVDELLRRDDAAGPQEQRGQEGALSRPPEGDRALLAPHLERAEDQELLHAGAFVTPFAHRRPNRSLTRGRKQLAGRDQAMIGPFGLAPSVAAWLPRSQSSGIALGRSRPASPSPPRFSPRRSHRRPPPRRPRSRRTAGPSSRSTGSTRSAASSATRGSG